MSLKEIVYSANEAPTIVNDDSKFVVVSYYWGHDNLNSNLSRPCVSFYEDVLTKMQDIIINNVLKIKNPSIINSLEFSDMMSNLPAMKNLINRKAKSYMGMINEDLGISNSDPQRFQKALSKLERFKEKGKTPLDYEYKEEFIVEKIFDIVLREMIELNKDLFKELVTINAKMRFIEIQYKVVKNKQNVKFKELRETLSNLIDNKNKISEKIKANLKIKKDYYFEFRSNKNSVVKPLGNNTPTSNDISVQTYISRTSKSPKRYNTPINSKISNITGGRSINLMKQIQPRYKNMSIYDIFIKELRYLNPITYGEMTARWKQYCDEANCNYLVINYPQFAVKGGYQMAINAKPLFIKKALELCYPRSVVYIDTDMLVRKYPSIFDMDDVDHMARGWHIDPRGSYKSVPYEDGDGVIKQSIMFDPYTYETSGGTMYFSQSEDSKALIDDWISESSKQNQKGKADDRILSLIFNTNKLLLSMKIIQLPTEYLWLSLDYDERNLEHVYDYNFADMKSSIFFEHPECLTSEDTASGAGASSDRLPKFYGFLDYTNPISEEFFEYIMFPNKEMTEAFRDYHNYMNTVTYICDGNDELVKKGFVDCDNPENNEQPMYIVNYENKFGNKRHPEDINYTYTQISEINMQRANNMNLKFLGTLIDKKYVEITDTIKNTQAEIISLIIRLLNDGKTVIYNPSTKPGYNKINYEFLNDNINGIYKNFEFVFCPKTTQLPVKEMLEFSAIFRPRIEVNQVMLFRPGNRILTDLLSLFLSFESLADYIHNGAYQFISRIRIGFIIIPKHLDIASMKNTPQSLNDYSQSLIDAFSLPNLSQSRSRRISRKSRRSRSRSRSRKSRRSTSRSRSRKSRRSRSKSRKSRRTLSTTRSQRSRIRSRKSKTRAKTIDGKKRRKTRSRKIRSRKIKPILKISDICYETFPCQHDVEYNGKKVRLNAKQIYKILHDSNQEIPKHFIQ